jgi:hypothetical protein
MAMAGIKDWEIRHMDMKSAFLNRELVEALYRLWHAPHVWNIRLDERRVDIDAFKKQMTKMFRMSIEVEH